MSMPTNDTVAMVTTKRTIGELQTTLTGTFTSGAASPEVLGVGSLLLTEIGGDQGVGSPTLMTDIGAWLVDLTNSEVRRIAKVIDNTHLILKTGFTNAQAGSTLYYLAPSRIKFLGIANPAGGAILNGVTLPANFTANYGNESDSAYVVDPMILDATSGTTYITVQYSGTPL